ncbi:hypothetical protein JAAARDRAFT_38100 [Jaapia argillacea MUCL 33604]|uniref:PEBP-like protein n=1 Tax=Jaapia argillacea MUCL 33604 TaxID=933084 RepID=A0A067PJM5_9AGAM|nr:hypothetical protein JAAARDRAFT_38100 [Jaapia argillacea MUCL 33604]
MLALRRLRARPTHFLRGNATLQAAEPVADAAPPPPLAIPPKVEASPPSSVPEQKAEEPAPTKAETDAGEVASSPADVATKTRGRVYKLRRPNISATRPREWARPLAPGVLPAYDEAIKVIKADSWGIKKEIFSLEEALKAKEAAYNKLETSLRAKEENGESQDGTELLTMREELEKMREKLEILHVQSEINLPDVRWKAFNGMADLTRPVYRRLVEQRWRSEGDLDLLMERIHQMNVVPDLVPSLHPTIDLRVTFPEPPPKSVYLRTRVKRKHQQVEPGTFLLPQQTRKSPSLYVSVFHEDVRYYTLLMVDLDVPDEENQSYQNYLHWMVPNIPLNVSSTEVPLGASQTSYIPPHPQQGTPYHRYVLLLLPHNSPTERISVPAITMEDRLGFSAKDFCEKHGLDGSKGGGAHMWREVWDEDVSNIYQVVLKKDEPKFGPPPKADRYAAIRGVKRYV